ncbi:MAG: thioesterase family protein [Flavobacteriaceae bacterium]
MRLNSFSFRVRYGETDQMGVVYHGNYAQYLELGRIEWLRALGITYRSMEENGIMLPVISLQIDYKKSALYDDLITVETNVEKVPMVKIAFTYKLYNESRELLATAHTVLAFMDKETKRPMKCPEYILDKFNT